MWLVFLLILMGAALAHSRFSAGGEPGRLPALLSVYILAGYCGIGQIVIALVMLLKPEHLAIHLGIPFASPTSIWVGSIYLGAAVSATLTIWIRGNYLLGPAIVWSTFFAGATYAHLYTDRMHSLPVTPLVFAWTFATHGLVSIIVLGTALRARGRYAAV